MRDSRLQKGHALLSPLAGSAGFLTLGEASRVMASSSDCDELISL